MHTHRGLVTVLLLGSPLVVAGCGSGGLNASAASGTNDSADAGADADYDDGFVPPPPVGTQLQAGNSLSVRAITPDGYLVYSDDSIPEAYAMPIAGGSVQDLGPLGSKFEMDLRGSDFFFWSNVDQASVGTLSVWSSTSGLHSISSASYTILSNASASGSQILYVDNVSADGSAGDVTLAGADGSGKVKLLSQIGINDPCAPNMAFAGNYVVVSYCPAGSSGSFPATLATFSASSGAPGALVAHTTGNWWTDSAGTRAIYATAGGVSVVPLTGGGSMLIDATGMDGFLSPDGTSAYYVTSSDAFKSSPTTEASPTTLVPNGFNQWQGLSNDWKQLLYYSNYTANGTDLFVTSIATPGLTATISSATNVSIPGQPYTTDSTHVIYASAGVLQSYSIAGATTSGPLGSNIFMCYSATAAKIVYTDDFHGTNELRFGRANIETVDTAGADTPVRLVTDADAVFALTPAADQIVYAWSAIPGANAGIWTIPVP